MSVVGLESGDGNTYAIASPLGEDGEDDIGRKTVSACTRVEERAIIPPALVGTLPANESVWCLQ
jgi:hypothetical protein